MSGSTSITRPMIEAAATAIANNRAARGSNAPAISNVLAILPQKLKDEVLTDAEDALRAAGAVAPAMDCAWDDATRIAINADAEARIAALEASLPFAVSRHLSTICSHLLSLYDASEDPKVREIAVAIRACAAEASEAFAEALAAEAARMAALPDDAILRVTIVVRPKTTAAQLTFAPKTTFEAGRDALDGALRALQAQRDESRNCPAWKDEFATDGAPNVSEPSTRPGNVSSRRRDIDRSAAPTASGGVGGTVSEDARDDVKCRCVGTFGPNPECGACGGSGCIGVLSDLGDPEAARRARSALMRLFDPAPVGPGKAGDR